MAAEEQQQQQEVTAASKSASYEPLLWARVRELASFSLMLYGFSLIILGIGVAVVYGDLTIELVDSKAELGYIAGAVLVLCSSVLMCFVFGPLTGFLGLAVVRRQALQGWKTVATISSIMLFVSTLIGTIGLNLFKATSLSILMVVATMLLMVIALLGTAKNLVTLGALVIASSGLLVPLIAGYEHLVIAIRTYPRYLYHSYPYIAIPTAIYLNLGALVALLFIGIALVVKSLNLTKPLHSLSSAVGVAVYTLGLVFVAAEVSDTVNYIKPDLRLMVSEMSVDLFVGAGITASVLLAICGFLAFVSALLMIGSILKNILSKRST